MGRDYVFVGQNAQHTHRNMQGFLILTAEWMWGHGRQLNCPNPQCAQPEPPRNPTSGTCCEECGTTLVPACNDNETDAYHSVVTRSKERKANRARGNWQRAQSWLDTKPKLRSKRKSKTVSEQCSEGVPGPQVKL